MDAAPKREVGCDFAFEFLEPSVLALQIAPPTVLTEVLTVVGAPEPVLVTAANGGRSHIIESGAGTVRVNYTATCAPTGFHAAELFSEEVLIAGRQSRYCPSDEMAEFATREMSAHLDDADLADQVASWVFERTAYDLSGISGPSDTAVDTLLAGRGVCRDFAHLTIAMCRALQIPARLVSAYAPGLDPMDFHAVVEVWRGERWDVLDPSRQAPRSSLVRIATGRDAADTAFAATVQGDVELVDVTVYAVVDGQLPADDHVTPTTLA